MPPSAPSAPSASDPNPADPNPADPNPADPEQADQDSANTGPTGLEQADTDSSASPARDGGSGGGEPPADEPPDDTSDAADGGARPAAARRGGSGTFRSLRVRNYRLFFLGQMVSNTGTWMQRVAQDWMVLSITGSATAVGITTALQFLPMLLLGLYGGVIADRYPKRKLLLVTQSGMGLVGAFLAVVTLTGAVSVWHVYLAALLLGMLTVLDNPSRQSFASEMVGQQDLRNAVSLNSANFQTARLVGPAVAGVIISGVGAGWAFGINAVSFVAPVTGLLLMRPQELHSSPALRRGKGQLREGMRYVGSHPHVLWPIVLAGFIGTFGFNFPVVLAAFADKVFHTDAGAFGLLNTAMAIGSLIGALVAARRSSSRMRTVVAAAFGFGLLETVAALAPAYWAFAAMLIPVGALGLTVNTLCNSQVQLASDPAMRGRVMGLYMLVFAGGTPFGGPLSGWITEQFGARVGLVFCGVISLAAAVAVGLVLARIGGLTLRMDLRRGGRVVALVPRRHPDPKVSSGGEAAAQDGTVAVEAPGGQGPRGKQWDDRVTVS